MYLSTSQTLLFANHGLHPKFGIQGEHKIMNLTTTDRAMWLADVQIQLVSNFKVAQR